MICDTCFDREQCTMKPTHRLPMEACPGYFPDLTVEASREPAKILTPEDRRQPLQKREA